MEIIVYALDIEGKALKKHFSTNVRFEKCGVKAKNINFLKNLNSNDHITNIGICAGANVGEIYLCNKIIGEKTYYPDLYINNNLEHKQIKTVNYVVGPDEVENNPETLFDQEAAIIFKESTKYISPHQISFLKIVSDNGISNFEDTRKQIPTLIEKKIPEIETFITSSRKFFKKIQPQGKIQNLEKYAKQLKCTATMKAQLAQLLRYAQICNINTDKFFRNIEKPKTKKESLELLNKFNTFLLQ